MDPEGGERKRGGWGLQIAVGGKMRVLGYGRYSGWAHVYDTMSDRFRQLSQRITTGNGPAATTRFSQSEVMYLSVMLSCQRQGGIEKNLETSNNCKVSC